MENSKIVLTTLDNKTEVAVEFQEVSFCFTVRPHQETSTNANTVHYAFARDAIAALQRRGYQYAEDLVRLAVSAVRANCYA